MSAWRPKIFKSQKDLEDRIKGFTEYCIEKVKPMTLERLAVFLDCDSDTIRNYEKNDEFFGTIKAIKSLIIADKVERLNDRSTFTPGIVFDLKNNHNWKDKTETEYSWNFWINMMKTRSTEDLMKELEE